MDCALAVVIGKLNARNQKRCVENRRDALNIPEDVAKTGDFGYLILPYSSFPAALLYERVLTLL